MSVFVQYFSEILVVILYLYVAVDLQYTVRVCIVQMPSVQFVDHLLMYISIHST